jgi:uncharacterized protein (TIGR03083 family)
MVGHANHEAVVDDLVEVWRSLTAACKGIRAEEWDLATDCPGWTVRDQLSHIVGVEQMALCDGQRGSASAGDRARTRP